MLERADAILKLCAAAAILIAGCGVGYYYGIFLPSHAETQAARQEASARQARREARSRAESEQARQLQPVHAVDFFLLGDEWYRRGRLGEALKAFEHALRLKPDDFWAQFFLAMGHLEAHRPAEAGAGLTACLARQPSFPWPERTGVFVRREMRQRLTADRTGSSKVLTRDGNAQSGPGRAGPLLHDGSFRL